jgi:hypothetical protein
MIMDEYLRDSQIFMYISSLGFHQLYVLCFN